MYEEIFEQPTLLWKLWQTLLRVLVSSLFLLFIVGWSSLVFELITNPSSFDNATFGVFDTLG